MLIERLKDILRGKESVVLVPSGLDVSFINDKKVKENHKNT